MTSERRRKPFQLARGGHDTQNSSSEWLGFKTNGRARFRQDDELTRRYFHPRGSTLLFAICSIDA
ncbi:bsr8005 [Bradyrhizobium diazoefficiens USDA 110]|uniref:Bsr8005 protein n=1 Tax=Bradyrhizobium diazoefficiens (strain JCM 10833 / BCRC 13528 / IAM 13628 / NBRC 14792 / USDA 110) TaxID=224911 RepID=Q89BZ3_BRADU|nr:bsr8005 [Bradyrhizobium diazoefficiens USDA 110]